MCGIVGIVGGPDAPETRAAVVRSMADTLAHRGPDGSGFAQSGPCALGFRRLAIIDVEAPSPPFANEDRTVWSVCNGQIYNAESLAERLRSSGHRLHSATDTEVITHLYEESGPDLVDDLNGMFALALWDQPRRRLMLARDRAGEKPLFYWVGSGELVFASEMRALFQHPRVPRALDPVALRRYLLHDFFPAPLTPIQGIRKLPAGHRLLMSNGTVEVSRYWDLADFFEPSNPVKGRRSDLVHELDHRISTAIRRRSRSDVPFGVFLSGGIDSSTVLAHVAEQQGAGIPVFSLGHSDAAFDESDDARETARYFGADFHRLVLTEHDLEEGLSAVSTHFDEPLGDASIIPTHLLSRLANSHVKVVLSGEGADELFAGYPTYIGGNLADAFQKLPRSLRSALKGTARRLVPRSMGNVGLDYLLERFFSAAESNQIERHHRWFGSFGTERIDRILAPEIRRSLVADDPFESAYSRLRGRDFPDRLSPLLYSDFTMYLQDGLLTKVDRSAMLASLEVRAPFLDHELAEFVAGLDESMKLKGFSTKVLLREAVRDRLPAKVLKRRKRGFNIPLSRWLLHGLGDRLRHRFSPERVEARGLFSADEIGALLGEHMERKADHRKPIFTLMMFDLWCDTIFGAGVRPPVAESAGEK